MDAMSRLHTRVLAAAFLLAGATVHAQPVDSGMATTAPGISIYYERHGTGANVVMVPNRLFMPEWRQLSRVDRTLILYDMRNRGKSGRVQDTTQITIEGDVQDLEALRRHFRAERVSLVGYSYLGLMVALYATRYPDRVERLVQIGPVPRQFGTPYPADQTADASTLSAEGMAASQAWRAAYARGDMNPPERCEAFSRFIAFLVVGNPTNASRVPNVCVHENEQITNQERHLRAHFGDLQKRVYAKEPFTRLGHPVLTVHGTMDRNAPYGSGLEWATTFPNGRLITVVGGAHQVWLDDDRVLADVSDFLAGSWPARAQVFGRQ
jgi:pimeloyl-ACP methyl ester carboxylesterase